MVEDYDQWTVKFISLIEFDLIMDHKSDLKQTMNLVWKFFSS